MTTALRSAPFALLAALLLPAPAAAQFPSYVVSGDDSGDQLGKAVGDAGDVNGDGYGDFAVGAPFDDTLASNGGTARVYSGLDGVLLYEWFGPDPAGQFGGTVAGGGDLDNDGFDDVAIGAPWFQALGPIQGRAEVRSGLDGTVLYAWEGPNPGALFGDRIDLAGDVDGDGHDDVIIGASNDDGNAANSGIVYVYSGLDGSQLYQVSGDNGTDQLGFDLDYCGDVDGDGLDDFIAGAPFMDQGGSNAGHARVYRGLNGGVLHALDGANADDRFGSAVAGLGDIDGDSFADFAVGAWGDDTAGMNAGSVTVYSGQNATVITTLLGQAGDFLGYSIANAGDYDGDGVTDLLVGSKFEAPAGAVRVYSGASWNVLGTVDGVVGAGVGEFLAGGFDVNLDGFDEFVLGVPSVASSTGEAVVYSIVNLLGSAYCFGDGSATPCPCGNLGGSGEGCANSSGAGATLDATGSASVSNDDLAFQVSGLLPAQPALLFVGLNAVNGGNGIPFGDGLRCAGGSVVRLGTMVPDAQGDAGWGPGLSGQGGWGAGDLRRFQCWYRDPAGSPCGNGFNLSNGFEVSFTL